MIRRCVDCRQPRRCASCSLDHARGRLLRQRGTAEHHIKEGENAIVWTRLSCREFQSNSMRRQLHALANNLGNFMRTLALPFIWEMSIRFPPTPE
jgi:hypothetical protein